MFDTMVFTKVVGAFCGALLIFLVVKWGADELYHVGGYGLEQAYTIDVGDDDAPTDAGPEVSFAQLFAAANPSAGERHWNQCRACHVLEQGVNGVGPYLYGVVGRDVGTAEGFNYSGALVAVADVWTPEKLSEFIANPRNFAPGTTMAYSGMANPDHRADLIAYILVQAGGSLDDYAVEEAAVEEEVIEEAAVEPEAPEAETSEVVESPEADAPEAPEAETAEVVEAPEAAAPEAPEAETAEVVEAPEAAAPEAPEAEPTEVVEAPVEAGDSEFAALVASMDPDSGRQLWNQCRACHALEEGVRAVGPDLHGIVGREVGAREGYNYTGALSAVADVWTYDNLNKLLENPRAFAPGTTMVFAGIRSEEDRARLIAFLEAQSQ